MKRVKRVMDDPLRCHFSDCKTGLDIQGRINWLAVQEARDLNAERERYDEWQLQAIRAGRLMPPDRTRQ